jgi:hypothetical protein
VIDKAPHGFLDLMRGGIASRQRDACVYGLSVCAVSWGVLVRYVRKPLDSGSNAAAVTPPWLALVTFADASEEGSIYL